MPLDLGGGKGALEALRSWWGERHHARSTRGHPGRTRALAALYAASMDARALSAGRTITAATAACDLELPQLDKLAEELAHAWSGEDGWDTQQLIAAVKAAADKQEMPAMTEGGL